MTATAQLLTKAAVAFKNKQGHVLSELLLPNLNDADIEQITEELLPVRQPMMPQRTYKEVKQRFRSP